MINVGDLVKPCGIPFMIGIVLSKEESNSWKNHYVYRVYYFTTRKRIYEFDAIFKVNK